MTHSFEEVLHTVRRRLRSCNVKYIIFCLSLVLTWIVAQQLALQYCFSLSPNDRIYSSLQTAAKDDSCTQFKLKLRHFPQYRHCLALLNENEGKETVPMIYMITPTYERPVQKAELTRISYALSLVPNIHWIVVEDRDTKSALVSKLLERSQLSYTHLTAVTPAKFKTTQDDPNWLKPRGVLQRNAGIRWLRERFLGVNKFPPKGVVYFGDDDNTYDVALFEEMRFTNKVSVWPVAFVGGLMVERPLVDRGRVVGFNTMWGKQRPYPIDMAGFAVNLTLLVTHRDAWFSLNVQRGYQESHLLTQLITDKSELEPKASDCLEVLVWHTRTEKPKLKQELKLKEPSNAGMEV